MSKTIYLKKGLDIPVSGAAAQKTGKSVAGGIVAVKPTDFKGIIPKLLVREGDTVEAGTPLFADKLKPEILFCSPASGTVKEIVRGEKRKLLEVRIESDGAGRHVDFGIRNIGGMNAGEIRDALLKSGLWPAIIQRPYGTVADPAVKPKAIFVSAFSTAPNAAVPEYALKDEFRNIQTGVDALSALTDGGVHFSLNSENCLGTPFHKIENVIQHTFSGKHPAGNVGVQIHHISPIRKGETVWTVSLLMLAAIGKLFNTGKFDLSRKVAVTGPCAKNPCYVDATAGMSMKDIAEYCDDSAGEVRFISGDVLTGTNVGPDGFLGFYDNQVSLLKEGREFEMLGWAKPFRTNLFSASRAYFSWLTPKKRYDMDTNTHGGERAFVMSDVYGKVLPMKLFPVHLIKACMAGNIDKMEELGIYEVIGEDIALCEFVCPSKIEWIAALENGIDTMLKEMA